MVAMYDKEGNAVYVKLKDQAKMMEPEHGYTLPDEFKVGQNRRVNEIIAGYMTDPALSVNEVKEGVLAQVSTEKLSVDLKDTMVAIFAWQRKDPCSYTVKFNDINESIENGELKIAGQNLSHLPLNGEAS